jgi:hypothetical protein
MAGQLGGRGNGDYRGALQSALQHVSTYLAAWNLPVYSGIVRADGQYGDEIVMATIIATGLHLIVRKRGYAVLAHPRIQAALAHVPIATITSPESQVTLEVFAVPDVVLEEATTPVRLILTRRCPLVLQMPFAGRMWLGVSCGARGSCIDGAKR